jgi:hypothetical protein
LNVAKPNRFIISPTHCRATEIVLAGRECFWAELKGCGWAETASSGGCSLVLSPPEKKGF